MTVAWPGVVAMTERRYTFLAALIGADLLEARPVPLPIEAPADDEQRALYVAINLAGFACYAGQTRPSSRLAGAARRRIRQHLRESSKAANWAAYWVFPLTPRTPQWRIDQLEHDLNARLGLPLRHRRHRD